MASTTRNSSTGAALGTLYLNTDGGKIAYDLSGEGPLVICAPSMGDLRQEYRFLVPQLVEAGYKVATLDVRGHGEFEHRLERLLRRRNRQGHNRPGSSPWWAGHYNRHIYGCGRRRLRCRRSPRPLLRSHRGRPSRSQPAHIYSYEPVYQSALYPPMGRIRLAQVLHYPLPDKQARRLRTVYCSPQEEPERAGPAGGFEADDCCIRRPPPTKG